MDEEMAVAELPPGWIAPVGVYAEAAGPDQDLVPAEKCVIDPEPDDDEADTVLAAPALNAANAYDSPERLKEYDDDTRRLMMEALQQVEAAEKEHDVAKEAAKECKTELEAAEKRLRRLIRERDTNRGKPVQKTLFDADGNPKAEAEVRAESHWAAEPDNRSPDEVPAPALTQVNEEDGWKALSINELVACGLKQSLADLLASKHGLDTLGKLHAYTEPSASGWVPKYTDLDGVGPAKADQVADAFIAFWPTWTIRNAVAHARATEPGAGGGGIEPGSGDGGGESRPAEPVSDAEWFNGQPAADPSPEPAPAQPAAAEEGPAGYSTDTSRRVAKRMRDRQGGTAG